MIPYPRGDWSWTFKGVDLDFYLPIGKRCTLKEFKELEKAR